MGLCDTVTERDALADCEESGVMEREGVTDAVDEAEMERVMVDVREALEAALTEEDREGEMDEDGLLVMEGEREGKAELEGLCELLGVREPVPETLGDRL